MFTAILIPINDHNAAAPWAIVPSFSTPTAVPAPVSRLIGARRQWTLEVAAGRNVLKGDTRIFAQFSSLGPCCLAVVGLRAQVLTGELVCSLVAHAGVV